LGFERAGTLRSRDVWKVAGGKFSAAPGVESLSPNQRKDNVFSHVVFCLVEA